MREPRLDAYHQPAEARGSIVMFHGGQQTSTDAVSDKHASWWRMALMARSLRRFAAKRDLSLHLVQYRYRGWNSSADPDPVRDARWALERVQEQHPGVPVVLVGHSMGGRTACRVADDPAVAGVVGLAPWLPAGEPNGSIRRRHLHVIHGTADRWTSAQLSRAYVERSRSIAADATWTELPGVGHFMLRRVGAWNGFVRDSVEKILASSRESVRRPEPEGRA
jgi:dienelactone hydrolase